MLRDERGLDARHQRAQLVLMRLGIAHGGAQAEAHAVQAQGIVAAHAFQHAQVRAARAEVVLGVHFQPAGGGPRARKLRVMPRAQPDAGAEPGQAQPFFILASLPGSPCLRLPPICTQVPALTTLKSFGS